MTSWNSIHSFSSATIPSEIAVSNVAMLLTNALAVGFVDRDPPLALAATFPKC
jgi:hypothetical protein